ncbi:hypothetical protein [Flavobacterium anhuiense]|uniref:hypothetical protein n=1 Tax=Flavobacterium anhuiense TaxID=459526 RepID=UPI003D99F542
MIKSIKIIVIIALMFASCKPQNDEKQNKKTNDNDSIHSNYLLTNKTFNLIDFKGTWELKNSSNSNTSKIINFDLLDSEFVLGNDECNAYFEIDTIHSLEYHIEGHFYNHSLKDEMKILDKKFKSLFDININSYKGALITKCSPPFHKLYLFGNNIVVWYSGNYIRFVKKSKKNLKSLYACKENDNGKSRYDDPLNKICECNESTFERAYAIFYNESPDYLKKDLLEKLPQRDFLWKSEDADVTYKWILRDTLKIEMSYDGGENNYIFYKNSNNKMEYKEYLSLP